MLNDASYALDSTNAKPGGRIRQTTRWTGSLNMVGDQHGPYWALISQRGELHGQLIKRPGPHFIGNAQNARQRIARVMVVEVSPDHRPATAQDEEAEHG